MVAESDFSIAGTIKAWTIGGNMFTLFYLWLICGGLYCYAIAIGAVYDKNNQVVKPKNLANWIGKFCIGLPFFILIILFGRWEKEK